MRAPIKILFICTGNSCRSQMAEAILRSLGGERFEALSAGSHPAGYVHDLAVAALASLDVFVADQFSKSWNEFLTVPVDLVVTLCDAAAAEVCPRWPGDPVRVHWPVPDPAFHFGTADERLDFAIRVAERLRAKIQAMIDLDWSMDRTGLAARLATLAEI